MFVFFFCDDGLAVPAGLWKAGGWHVLRDEERGCAGTRFATPIAALWACNLTRRASLRSVRPARPLQLSAPSFSPEPAATASAAYQSPSPLAPG